jgi:hypothetical protein
VAIKENQDIARGGSPLPVLPGPERLHLHVQDDRRWQAPDPQLPHPR